MVKLLLKLSPAGHMVIGVMFIGSAFALLAFAGFEWFQAVVPFNSRGAAACIGSLLY